MGDIGDYWPARIKAFRAHHNLTQEQFAKLLSAATHKVSDRTVQRWEAGDRKPAPYLKRALRDLERELSGPKP